MEKSIEKLNAAIVAITEDQQTLTGEDLLTSLKAVKATVRAIELMAKVGKVATSVVKPVVPELPMAVEEPVAVEPEEVKTISEPVAAATAVEQAVKDQTESYRQRWADEAEAEGEAKYALASDATKAIVAELVKNAEDQKHVQIYGGKELGWCEYHIGHLLDQSRVEENAMKDGKSLYISEIPLRNPADCRLNSRWHFNAYDDGRFIVSGYKGSDEIVLGVLKRRGKESMLTVMPKQAVDSRQIKAGLVCWLNADDLKQAMFD